MKGEITATRAAGDARVATVQLEGEEAPRAVTYWPELLQQWGAEALRAHLIHAAEQAAAAEQELAGAGDHEAILGGGEGAPVCAKGHIGCNDDHAPQGASDNPAEGVISDEKRPT